MTALQLTYGELFARAAALGKALREQFGLTRGMTVAVVTANRPEWIISLLAITGAGGIAALVNSRGVAEEMLRAIEKVGCRSPSSMPSATISSRAARPDPAWPRIVIGEPKRALRPGRDGDFAALAAPVAGLAFEPEEMPAEQGAIILFTSGTTGFPKGALLSHGALAASVAVACFMGTLQDIRYEEESGETLPDHQRSMATPAVILGPMFHLSGIMPSLRAISVGTTIHIMGKWNADVALDMIEHVGMTRLSFVAAMLFDIFASPRATPELLRAVRYMVNGAAPLDMALVEEIKAPHAQLPAGQRLWPDRGNRLDLRHQRQCLSRTPRRLRLARADGAGPAAPR